MSDASSGISGNPTVGFLADELINQGGTVLFQKLLKLLEQKKYWLTAAIMMRLKAFLECVYRTEEEAKATGEDIRSINPIPANIDAGITTLEEKSLGAIAKAGHHSINGVLKYAQIPKEKGLYFMDSWMSSTSLFSVMQRQVLT